MGRYLPRRGDEVEAWLERARQARDFTRLSDADEQAGYDAIGDLLAEYRQRADLGVPLDGPVDADGQPIPSRQPHQHE